MPNPLAPPGARVVRGLRTGAVVLLAAVCVAALVVVAAVPLDTGPQALFGCALFAAALALDRGKSRTVTLLLTVTALVVTTRYMVWRVTSTLPGGWSLDLLFGGSLFLAELFSFVVLVLGYLQTAHPLAREPVDLSGDPSTWPSVDVLIPTYDEPLDVVRATVLAALELDWPRHKLRVCLLDDGNRSSFRAFAASVGAAYFARRDNHGAKAGNINAALGRTRGEYVAVFDCDHVPTRSFLQVTMGWFQRDAKLAMVQTPHHFYSPDPIERNLRVFGKQPNEGELFYGLLQPGNDLWNAVFFCGSCAVMRRSALEEVGGVAIETVTEDAHTALRMHRRGYRTAFLSRRQAAGLATDSLAAHIRQRIRWARGMAQIFRIDNPLLGRGLNLTQRLCYLNGLLYFFSGLPRLVFLTAPLAFLLFGAHIFNATPALVLAYALPHLAHSLLTASRIQGGFRASFWGELYETLLSVYIVVPTTLALFRPRAGGFNVTVKGGLIERSYFDWRIAAPFLVLLALNVIGLLVGLWRLLYGGEQTDAVLINIAWAMYDVLLLSVAVATAFEREQRRLKPRVTVDLEAVLRYDAARSTSCTVRDLSLRGACVACPPELRLAPGDRVTIGVLLDREEMPLPGRVMRAGHGQLGVELEPASDREEVYLVRALFSRADAWTRRPSEAVTPGSLGSLVAMTMHAMRGLARVLGTPTAWRTG